MADEFKTPQLVLTNAGLAAAQVATPVGPFIHIAKFRIGSAFGYTPTRDQTDINGELLYEGEPLSYKYVGDNTLNIVCRLPAEAGPFQFGEVAIDLEQGPMFAKAVFETPQIKYSSLGTNVLSTYTFNCLLKLDQAVAVFKINTNCLPPDIWEVDYWSDVYPPGVSANPDIPAILVREPDPYGNATLIVQESDVRWSMAGNYRSVIQATVMQATTTSVDFARSEAPNLEPGVLAKEYVLTFANGYMRACTTEVYVADRIRFNFTDPLPTAPPVGSKVVVNSMLTNQTKITLTGGASGSAVIKGHSVTLEVSIDRAAALARSATYEAVGTYELIVPEGVSFLYLDGGGAGGGGAGAGGGFAASDWPYPDESTYPGAAYRGGGGGGGGGAGRTVSSVVLPVTPGETVTVTIGAAGLGGLGGTPGNNGQDGQDGGTTTVSGSFGTITMQGGTGGTLGGGWGAPSNRTGDGGPGGVPGGVGGIDGQVGAAGGPGGTSAFGAGGSGGRGATGNPTTLQGASGENGNGNSSGGGGGGSVYSETSRDRGGDGGNGTDGFVNLTW